MTSYSRYAALTGRSLLGIRTALCVVLQLSVCFVQSTLRVPPNYHAFGQWPTEEGGLGGSNPPPPNSKDIGGVRDRMSKKSRRLDFLL